MDVYHRSTLEPLGRCSLQAPATAYFVLRAVDAQGEYHRLRLTVLHPADGAPALGVEEREQALFLPGFLPLSAGEKGGSPIVAAAKPAKPHGLGMVVMAPAVDDHDGLKTKVMIRLLELLAKHPLLTPAAIPLEADEVTAIVLPLPPLPEGNLFLVPDPAWPIAMENIGGRIALGASRRQVEVIFQATSALVIPAGTHLGLVELRSPSELPEGMRDKVFQSYLMSKLEELRR